MEKVSNPILIKRNLLIASLFITSFEILRNTIIDKIKGFLCLNLEINNNGLNNFKISKEYKKQILERNIPFVNKKNKDYHLFISSCLWLKDNNIINENDMDDLEKIRNHRNKIAHEPLKLLVDDNVNINLELLNKSKELLAKIEKRWIIYFELTLNSEFDSQIVNEDNIYPGLTIFVNYLFEIANVEIKRKWD
jgi:hypothetical protein